MSINKIVIIVGIIFTIFITFILIQFNPLGRSVSKNASTQSISIKDQTFTITIVKTEAERQKGLSGRASLPLDEGMLFLFDKPDSYAIWMKNMKFPIDIIFIRDDKIVTITENAKPATTGEPPIYQPSQPSDKILEINAGLSKKNNFKPGDTVKISL